MTRTNSSKDLTPESVRGGKEEKRPLFEKGDSFRTLLKKAFLSDDSPRQIALGAAIGMFVACSPFIGLQAWIALPIALGVRANRLSTLGFTLLANPFTMPILYTAEGLLGGYILGISHPLPSGGFSNLSGFLALGTDILLAVLAGFVIIGAVSAVITYVVTLNIAVVMKRKKKSRRVDDEDV
ncbi:MAG: DUF2062 domain-containing protein [Deltaproteobacteria bacterium]|nr:DUF2062 domain-containing protein [Candidatus Zymogenaceae bacterium]